MDKLERLDDLFAGRHFDREVILLCVRWYLRFKLSLRNLVEMMAERGLSLAHTTIMRWVQHYTPEFEKRWHRHALTVGRSWRVDETYVKIRGVWHYLYRAVDQARRTVDSRLSARRDVAAAKAFFRKAIKNQKRPPQTITLDGYAASHRAMRELKADGPLMTPLIFRPSRKYRQRPGVRRAFRRTVRPAAAGAAPAWWDEFVEHAALTEQRVGTSLGGVRLEKSIVAERFAGGAEQGQQRDGECVEQPQTVAAL